MKTQSKQDKFQKVVKSATLKEVILISSKCESYFHYSIVNPPKTKLEFTRAITKPDISETYNKTKDVFLSTHIEYKVNGKSKEDIKNFKIKKDSPLFFLSASYIVTYIIKKIDSLDREMLEFFGKDNAFFNVYPYLRECITHMSTRLNIPPVILPLLKPNNELGQKKTTNQKKLEKPKKAKNK